LNNSFQIHKLQQLYNALALPVLLYGRETWTSIGRDVRRITAAEKKYMRRTAGYTYGQITKQMHKLQRIRNNINFGQITGIQERLDTTCK